MKNKLLVQNVICYEQYLLFDFFLKNNHLLL